jgi:hypothetical protein
MATHLKIFEKNAFLFKEDLFALCALDMAYTDLYARKKERSYMTIELYYREQSINRLHNRDCFIEKMVSK